MVEVTMLFTWFLSGSNTRKAILRWERSGLWKQGLEGSSKYGVMCASIWWYSWIEKKPCWFWSSFTRCCISPDAHLQGARGRHFSRGTWSHETKTLPETGDTKTKYGNSWLVTLKHDFLEVCWDKFPGCKVDVFQRYSKLYQQWPLFNIIWYYL